MCGISKNSGFLPPKSSIFNKIFHYEPSIFGNIHVENVNRFNDSKESPIFWGGFEKNPPLELIEDEIEGELN